MFIVSQTCDNTMNITVAN